VLGTHPLSELEGATWLVRSLEEVEVRVLADGLELRFAPVGVESQS
jgi:hypothetical protein